MRAICTPRGVAVIVNDRLDVALASGADGVHLGTDDLPIADTEKDFGHAISTDLYHWQQLPPVMAVDPQGWDNRHVWAPHIVYSLGLYWMYYTGVTHRPPQYMETQRMGLAVGMPVMAAFKASSVFLLTLD